MTTPSGRSSLGSERLNQLKYIEMNKDNLKIMVMFASKTQNMLKRL